MRKPNASCAGFSLVEVTLALGVVVLCLVSVFGLLAVGINSASISIDQTSATNILTSIAADLEATKNPSPKNTTAQTSPIFNITIPAGLSSSSGAPVMSATPTTSYIGEDGQPVAAVASARYQLNVWTAASTKTQQETLVRLLISWPARATTATAQGYVETVIALNRT